MKYMSLQNLPDILMSLDFRKAFDSIEWSFIMKTLDYFNFGSDIKRWIKIFYTKQKKRYKIMAPQPCKDVRENYQRNFDKKIQN